MERIINKIDYKDPTITEEETITQENLNKIQTIIIKDKH